jgi:hypothetical protein
LLNSNWCHHITHSHNSISIHNLPINDWNKNLTDNSFSNFQIFVLSLSLHPFIFKFVSSNPNYQFQFNLSLNSRIAVTLSHGSVLTLSCFLWHFSIIFVSFCLYFLLFLVSCLSIRLITLELMIQIHPLHNFSLFTFHFLFPISYFLFLIFHFRFDCDCHCDCDRDFDSDCIEGEMIVMVN